MRQNANRNQQSQKIGRDAKSGQFIPVREAQRRPSPTRGRSSRIALYERPSSRSECIQFGLDGSKFSLAKGRETNAKIKLGICGEHGGDPDSVKFCHRIGLNYVSCSPYRVPVARLAAAQAAIEEKRQAKTARK